MALKRCTTNSQVDADPGDRHAAVVCCGQQPLYLQPSTLNPQPSTRNLLPSTFKPQPTSRNPQPSTLNPQPSTHNPQPSNLSPQPSTFNPQPSTLNTQPSTPNPQPSTLNHTINLKYLILLFTCYRCGSADARNGVHTAASAFERRGNN